MEFWKKISSAARTKNSMKAVPKVMPTILLFYYEADGGDMTVEVECFHQYSVPFCCCVKDGSRGESDRIASDMEVHMKQKDVELNSSVWKGWHSLIFIDACRRFMETKQCL